MKHSKFENNERPPSNILNHIEPNFSFDSRLSSSILDEYFGGRDSQIPNN